MTLPPLPRISQTAPRPTCFLPLSLEGPNQQALSRKLSKLGIGSVCRDTLEEIFIEYLRKLRRVYEAQYENAFVTWQQENLYEEAYDQAFRKLLNRLFAMHSQETWHMVLDEVSKVFRTDSSLTVTQRDNASYEGAPLKTGRGHDSEAVRILEQAFKHSPNITPAEKFRLSEVTGLKPKQVTIWFQNRRNRKGKKNLNVEPTESTQPDLSPSRHESPPPSSPSRDFTLSEKKRKSYGVLGRSSPDCTDPDSDSPSSSLKKPRVSSVCSKLSDGSSSSYEYNDVFTQWGSPSSHSTSLSSESSGLSDFESPRRPRNIFDYMRPRAMDGKAVAAMPRLTISAPQHPHCATASDQKSPFLYELQDSTFFDGTRLDLSGLQLNLGGFADDKDFRESVQMALSMSSSEQGSSRSASSSSWASTQATTDDDGWVDEEDFDSGFAACHTKPIDRTLLGQASLTPPDHCNSNTAPGQASRQEIFQAPCVSGSHPANHSQTSADENPSISIPFSQSALFDSDSFGLDQLFESASIPAHLPSTLSHSQQQGFGQMPFVDPNMQSFEEIEQDLDLDMTDIQEFLGGDIFASSLPGSQQSNGCVGSADANVQGSNGGASIGEGILHMDFDPYSNSFSLA
ncbi:b mating type locus, bW1 allele [Mycosarcoma maydis]|uniref:B mating type locus, bW1 allele n=1 Tax=Mycosarcoma maydis TaxID=5270 RepID=A0A0D1ED63_MYCMD|nr:b mating type locus, bW1 allele [Ustilago maydis 521]pir/B42094/ bw1 protein - smut fungus (Ustilago maydis) [Ustilago maydis]KIS72160.1 b mating type locus, bW1 allele [Ustilago maydis 521]|eukprot:XP_011386405.1 b mating type locus, bW1 allele [Ustilago maydis 521]